jgi:hypothetical protein
MAPEALFDPSLVDVEGPGIAEMAFVAIQEVSEPRVCGAERRADLEGWRDGAPHSAFFTTSAPSIPPLLRFLPCLPSRLLLSSRPLDGH